MTRREIRETVFKILFSLEFNDISEIREEAELELEHASLYDEDDNKMDAVAMTEEEKAYVIDRVEAVVAHITEIDVVFHRDGSLAESEKRSLLS